MDLGVAADCLGNVFKVLQRKMPGASEAERVKRLFEQVREFYDRTETDCRLDDLKPSMIQVKTSVPRKLRGKCGEIRALVPFAAEAAGRLLSDDDVFEATVRQVAIELAACYENLSEATFDSARLAASCKRFCSLYVSLASWSEDPLWRVKPKLHLMQELCEYTDNRPSQCWNYRDEDFGGTVAKLSRKRGGHNKPHVTGVMVLTKLALRQPLPRIV